MLSLWRPFGSMIPKIGARACPRRLSDYIAALYLVMSPSAFANRAKRRRESLPPLNKKRKTAGRDDRLTKSARFSLSAAHKLERSVPRETVLLSEV